MKIYQEVKTFIKKTFPYNILFVTACVLVVLLTTTFSYAYYKEIQATTKSTEMSQQSLEEDTGIEESTQQEVVDDEERELDDIEDEVEVEKTEESSESKTTTSTKKDEPEGDQSEDDEAEPEEEEEPEDPPAPESPSAVVAFYADNQSDTDQEDENHQRVVNRILSSGANPVFHGGDLMEDGTQDSLDRFNDVTSTLRSTRTFYAALGNNDRKVGDSSTASQLFLDNFSFPNNEYWYAVNYGNLHMVMLDSAFSSGSATQLSWLASDLQSSNSQDRITGIMFHHPTFASSISSYVVDYGVDFVISGHVHSYSHTISNGVDHFTMSGQPNIGYIIAKIYEDEVKMYVYNNSGGLIDSVEFDER